MAAIDYDYLVLGIGAQVNFFGVEGAAEHAFPMYTLTDAVRAQGARPAPLGGGRPRPVAGRGRRPAHRRGRRRADRGGEHRRARRALPQRLRQGLPRLPIREGAPDPGRGGAEPVHDVRAGASGVCAADARGLGGRGYALRGRLLGRAHACDPEVRPRPQGSHAGLGRGAPSAPTRGVAGRRARARQPDPGRARPQPRGAPGGVRRRRRRLDHGHQDRRRPAATRFGGPAGRPARGGEHRPPPRGQADRALLLPRQGDDGDDRPRRGGDPAPARPDDEGTDRVPRLGRRPPVAALDGRGPNEGDARLGLGGVHPRAREPDRGRASEEE